MAFPAGLAAVLAALVSAGEGPLGPDWVPRLMTQGEAACGYFPLFDGISLDGWEVRGENAGAFSVSSGTLRAVCRESRPWLVTTETYEHFELHYEFRMPTKDGQALMGYGVGADGGLFIQMLHGPSFMNRPINEWNDAEVVCRDGRFVTKVNGTECGNGVARPGPIGIQCSCDRVEFRNIKIKPLPGGEGWKKPGDSLPENFDLRFAFKPSADSRGGVAFVSEKKTVFEVRVDNHEPEVFTGSLAGTANAIELRALDDCWNHMRIGVDGPNIQVWVNGKTVVDFVSTRPFSCAGASARFNVENGSIQFEDIEIKAKE